MSANATRQSSTRDTRIDIARGAALFVIALNHSQLLPGKLRAGAFFDGADVFIFISGFVCGLAYYRVGAEEGLPGLLRKGWLRSLTLAAANAALIAGVAAVALAGVHLFGLDEEIFGAGAIVASPVAGLWEAVTFRGDLHFVDILILYVLLTAWLPFAAALYLRNRLAAAALSSLIWLYPVVDDNLGLPAGDTLGLNIQFGSPLSWQLLFSIGLFLGIEKKRGSLTVFRSPWLPAAAVATLLLCHLAGPLLPLRAAELLADKYTVRPLRIVELLALFYLLGRYLPRKSQFWKAPLLSPLRRAGARSLPFFCLSTVAATTFMLYANAFAPSGTVRAAAVALFLLLLTALAFLIEGFPPRRSKGPPAVTSPEIAAVSPAGRSDIGPSGRPSTLDSQAGAKVSLCMRTRGAISPWARRGFAGTLPAWKACRRNPRRDDGPAGP